MTIYLTKKQDGQIHHFRVTVKNNQVTVVNGIFYNWLGKYLQDCGDSKSAMIKQKELIAEKTREGFAISEFEEKLENTIDIYDKVRWHFESAFPEDLDNFQGYVHIGMFLGWLIETDLISEEFKNENAEAIAQFKLGQLTGPQVFEYCCDGILMLKELNERGNRFALGYFEFASGHYLSDYKKTLAQDLPSFYYVADTWDNYKKIKALLDKRFAAWQSQNGN